MTTQTERQGSTLDVLKLTVSVAIIIMAIVAFYYWSEESFLLRAVMMVVAAIVAIFIGAQTAKGKSLLQFVSDSRNELKKVVWPTYKETMQTTLMIAAVVLVVALILWGLDTLFGYIMRLLLS